MDKKTKVLGQILIGVGAVTATLALAGEWPFAIVFVGAIVYVVGIVIN